MPIEHDSVTSIHRGGYVANSDPGAVGAYRFWTDTTTTPHVLKVRNAGNSAWVQVGELITGSNVGTTGAEVYKQKTGQVLEFRKIRGATNVSVSQGANDISISVIESLLDKTQVQGYYREEYIASFAGTGAPTVDSNPLAQYGGAVFSRTGTGTYKATFAAVLPVGGVVTQATLYNLSGNPPLLVNAFAASPTEVQIETRDADGVLTDYTGSMQLSFSIFTTIPFLANAAGFWGWFTPESWNSGFDSGWDNAVLNPVADRLYDDSTDVDQTGTLNSYPVVQFSVSTNNGRLLSRMSPDVALIREVFIVMKMREATFSNTAGIISGPDTSLAPTLVGESGTTKFLDLGFTGHEYRLNNTLYANNNMQAPMNTWGIVHLRFPAGWGFTEVQFGRDRDFAGRYAEMDMAEALMFQALQPQSVDDQIYEYLAAKYNL